MIFNLNETTFIDTSKPLDISISLHNKENPVLAWYCDPIKLEPVMTERFIGDVNKGGAVNFRNLFMNPHAHGTHTECVGHISKEWHSINQCLKEFHFKGKLISVNTTAAINNSDNKEDRLITKETLEKQLTPELVADCECLIIRTLPNSDQKTRTNYSNTNPIYYTAEAIHFINSLGIRHLMVDLPSIDREEDGGELEGHHIFWNYPENVRLDKTITELIYAPESVEDGVYMVNIQITSLENDASPSKIILYEIQKSVN